MERTFRSKYIVTRGDTFEEPLELKDSDGNLITTNWTWKFTIRSDIPDQTINNDDDAVISKSGTFSDGESTLTISSTETNIASGTYYFDYQLTKPNGNIHSTLYGYFIVESDITRETRES